MGRPGGSSRSAGGDTGCSSQGHATEPPRRLTVQGDPVVLLHRLQRVRLPFEVHVRRPQAAARPVVVHGRLLQGPKLCKELLRTRKRGAHVSFRAADAQQLPDTTALGGRRSLSKPRRQRRWRAWRANLPGRSGRSSAPRSQGARSQPAWWAPRKPRLRLLRVSPWGEYLKQPRPDPFHRGTTICTNTGIYEMIAVPLCWTLYFP